MKLNQQNIFVRFILRTLDVIVALLAGGRIHWDRDPYPKATEAQKRVSGLFMALFPIAYLIFSENEKLFESWMDSMMYGHRSIIWLYLGVAGMVCFAFVVGSKVAPKIPLFISVPIAIMAWPIFLWCAWKHLL